MSRGGRATAALASLLAVAALCASAAGAAEVRRIEAVGAFGMVPGEAGKVPPRELALRKALSDAVRRVALDLLQREDTLSQETDARLREALGDDPLKYTTRFRILEDRGERPALFNEQEGVETEYVIVVDAHVDVDRVRQSLRRSGLFSVPSGEGSRVSLRLAVEMQDGAEGFGAYAALREALLGIRGVRSVLPVELERGRAVLAVESDRQARALLEALMRAAPPGLAITPMFAEHANLGLRVEWTAPAAAPLSGAIDTRTPKRY